MSEETGVRGRRRTTKQIDYSKEQEFSDEDIFEDGADSPSPLPTTSRKKAKSGDLSSSALTENNDASSKYRYTERGYDPTLPHLRERFQFLPEFEADGSPKVELIVGRRPVEDKKLPDTATPASAAEDDDNDDDDSSSSSSSSESSVEPQVVKRRGRPPKKKPPQAKRNSKKPKESSSSKNNNNALAQERRVEYEYLIKFKGKSYLHLEWKAASELESMNKSAKTLYRRFLKKLTQGTDCDDLEDPDFDNTYAQPQKILDEEDHEVFVELSDKELVEYERNQLQQQEEEEEELSEEEEQDQTPNVKIEGLDDDDNQKPDQLQPSNNDTDMNEQSTPTIKEEPHPEPGDSTTPHIESQQDNQQNQNHPAIPEEEIEDERIGDPGTLTLEQVRKILSKEGPYYPVVEGSDNPYRDGYVTEPPKKPRASYLFFQGCYRAEFQKRHRGATQSEIMTILGDTWRTMNEAQQFPFIELAKEEARQFEHHKMLLEKAQRPNELWQPIRRCRKVLDRLAADSFSTIFAEPVDTTLFPDYEEYVDQPMDLGTVRRKLDNRKYQGPENFARDMRKIWQNCKVYNQHGSAIWHVADYMSKQFERLYDAWVLSFRDRYIRWANPKARPWEPVCRKCDGQCRTKDEQMVLCDHCDAMYGMTCLSLQKLPSGVWHCPDCLPKLSSNDGGTRMFSAVAEQAARKRAEMGDIPKKKITQKMFLVKWAGLGYEHCTWETQEDINDDNLIAEFRRLNNMTPDEPDVSEEDLQKVFEAAEHLQLSNAGGTSSIPQLRCQLYSQTRAFHFLKFGQSIPPKLCAECGPKTKVAVSQQQTKKNKTYPEEVVECVNDLVTKVERFETQQSLKLTIPSLPPLLTGEYDAVVPITSKGLMMNVGEIHGSVAFLGYRTFPDGTKGPAEVKHLIRNVGDKIIAVDGISTVNKTFKEIIMMLRESGKNNYAYMRFLSKKYAVCHSDLTSMGSGAMFTFEDVYHKLRCERRRLIIKRRQDANLIGGDDDKEDEESDASAVPDEKSDVDDSDEEASVGDYIPDSDDEDLIYRQKAREHFANMKAKSKPAISPLPPNESNNSSDMKSANQPLVDNIKIESSFKIENANNSKLISTNNNMKDNGNNRIESQSANEEYEDEEKKSSELRSSGHALKEEPEDTNGGAIVSSLDKKEMDENNIISGQNVVNVPSTSEQREKGNNDFIQRQETTRSLSLRLLDIDVGYSSDEAGDEDVAYYLDGVDDTFTTEKDAKVLCGDPCENEETASTDTTTQDIKDVTTENNAKKSLSQLLLPAKKTEFSTIGDRSKICAAVTLTTIQPDADDFDNYPMPSTKRLEALKAKAEAEEKAIAEQAAEEIRQKESISSTEPQKLSKTKIEQLSTTSNEIIRVWASAEDAAATLQLSLKNIKQVLRGVYNEEVGDEVGGYRWRYAVEEAKVTKIADIAKEKDKGRKAFLEFQDKLYDHEKPHNYKNGNRLRDYQIDGVNWLASCWYKRHCCILADEMGLGKTVQIVTYIEHLFRVEKIYRPFLVVVPLSTVEHWRREFEGWTDMICCVYHDRQRVWRDIMREYEWYYVDRPHTPEFLKFDVLVTTYDTLIGDFDVIGQIPWRVTVVDEAHRLRNQKGKLLECMKEISARGTLQYGYQSRILMTGTPLQNNIQELWTLLNFIEPYKFPSLEEFESNYGNMASREQVEGLQRKISPFMLRRVKEDVAKDIPSKEETLIDVELTSIQKQYYRAIFEHNHSFLNMGSSRTAAPKLMNIQMELRKCCNHPFLLDGVEHRESEKQHRELLEAGKLDGKTPSEIQQILHVRGYVETSGKMVLLDKLLPKLRQEGHKVLIFSQMVKMLDLLSEYCDIRGFRFERLDGRVRGNERQKAIDRFETEKDSFIFMLSTRAGGVGINLTAADICIIFDSDWNPQNDVQAQARCHRIGQTKNVMIYRLITSRSFEQEMFDRASKKLGLEQAVLGTFGQDDDDGKPTAQEMEQLLKKGAYALLEDDNDEITKEFCADDIDSILAKRTRTRVVEGAKTATWLNKQGLVTKSKFTADSKSADLNVDDPQFWQKVMPDFVTPGIMLTKLEELETQANTSSDIGNKSRGRKRKPSAKQAEAMGNTVDENNAESNDSSTGHKHEAGATGKNNLDDFHLTRTNQKKVNKFIQDLKSMMDGILEDKEDDNLPESEKATCQKLLLTISCKEKLFSEEQRTIAKVLLKRLEGDRRRRCRTTGDMSRDIADEPGRAVVNEQLLIRSSKKRRKKRQKGERDDEPQSARKSKRSGGQSYVDSDGFLHNYDSEADWSDFGEDMYASSQTKNTISKKEARRRRAWASDKDAAAAAGRQWPSFPRNKVVDVLGTLLDEVIEFDKSKGGLFSEPVPRDVFPEYYDVIKKPMDYGTMKGKLSRGEYRSAQAMQKDFVLVMSNCIQFNSPSSEIVREARQQALMRPTLLKKAATEHKLFITEDGAVLEILTDDEDEYKENADEDSPERKKEKRKRGRKPKNDENKKSPQKYTKKKIVRCNECEPCKKEDCGECNACKDKRKFGGSGLSKQSCIHRNCLNLQEVKIKPKRGRPRKHKRLDETPIASMKRRDASKDDDDDGSDSSMDKKKPRIRISLSANGTKKCSETPDVQFRIPKKKKNPQEETAPEHDIDGSMSEGEIDETPKVKTPKRHKGQKSGSYGDQSGEDKEDISRSPIHEKERRKKKRRVMSGDDSSKIEMDVQNEKLKDDDNDSDISPRPDKDGDRKCLGFENVYMNLALIRKEVEALDGSFESARESYTKRGPWTLPREVGEHRFPDIAKIMMKMMGRHDRYSLFATPVRDEEAPGYSEIVKHPMDFGTMKEKLDRGEYGTGSVAASKLYSDFLLVMDNCALYNDDNDEIVNEAARLFGMIPEIFANACSSIVGKKRKGRRRTN